MQHLAVVFGDMRDGEDMPVRLHLEDVGGRCFWPNRQIDGIMKRIAEQGRGVIVYLREGSVGVGASQTARRGKHDGEDHDEGAGARKRMAGNRPWRTDPEGSRHHLDPPDGVARAASTMSALTRRFGARGIFFGGDWAFGHPSSPGPSSSPAW
jgi:hypothetical protein